MTELSDADREMAIEILNTWFEWPQRNGAISVRHNMKAAAAMLTAARRLITAEILAMAGIDEGEMVGDVWRILIDHDASLGFLSEVEDSRCKETRDRIIAAIQPHIARLAAENARMRGQLQQAETIISKFCGIVTPTEETANKAAAILDRIDRTALGEKP
jgi:hypothetical protein